MGRETPTRDRSPTERGLHANHGDDPTLASYLSSLFLILSVPVFITLAYGGYWADLYAYEAIVPVFAGIFAGSLFAVFGLMHVLTGR